MVVKVYISGISGNKEVKKRQQRVLMILDSKNIKYEIIDITEPGRESDKDFMQNNSKSNGATVSDSNPRSPLPPQVFNEEEYCGDYDQFDLANELDTLEQFLKLETPPEPAQPEETVAVNGDAKLSDKGSKENSQERESVERVAEEPKPEAEDSAPKEDKVAEEPKEKETSNESPEEEKKEDEREKTPEETEKPPEQIESNAIKDVTTMSNTDVVLKENGSAGSREASQEKEVEVKEKESPSETLIQSEQVAAAE
ncbi:SH3 domain-binding glutamic acid-rich protein homolog [Aricia agestis]|uniref:SH3 domain-binding glutamic acid-rich protein homolog n=1 Tax=Aricia agestis TaxID=91739 RepID=UPI001C2016B4|nr:SH3 domain-binding glutamic acid-rich protein homolog [Aricia agestis]